MIEALQINLNRNNMHLFGLTDANPMELKIRKGKFFALKRILNLVIPSYKGMKWLKVPENNYADFIGFELKQYSNGVYKMRTAYALELKNINK
jgi:hypothetical protein